MERYFVLTEVATRQEVDLTDPLSLRSGSKGTGIADGVRVWTFCLEGGDYSIAAFDVLGEGWWGGELSVNVCDAADVYTVHEETTVYEVPAWSGYQSAALNFSVAVVDPVQNTMEANAAPNGGGGQSTF